MEEQPVMVLDACVLYPAAQRDLFMWLAAGGVVHAHWSDKIHEEWMRNPPKTSRACVETLAA